MYIMIIKERLVQQLTDGPIEVVSLLPAMKEYQSHDQVIVRQHHHVCGFGRLA